MCTLQSPCSQLRVCRKEVLFSPSGLRPSPYLPTALILALWLPQGSQAALHIQKIPEQPQKNQDLLLSLHGVPSTVQDFIWYLGEKTNGGTRLFSYIPGELRPQRDGSAMGRRDIIGFPNGSMLLRGAQPSDSGTYQVAVTINPAWTMKAKTEVQVAGELGAGVAKDGRKAMHVQAHFIWPPHSYAQCALSEHLLCTKLWISPTLRNTPFH